jgi:cellulose synthase/poly-beta-1,6-N-acetylglucosamine synthase-like glycosyltransferase
VSHEFDVAYLLLTLLYGVILIVWSAYGLHFYYLTWLAWKHRKTRIAVGALNHYPMVTVQVPIYNERYVADRIVDAVCRLDWPRDRLEIQILDDSTDSTRELVAQRVARWRAAGVDVAQLHRSKRTGYKAGALGEGLAVARGEFMAIFDADFLPPPDFLQRTIPYLLADPRAAFVQARWGHLNRKASLLTQLQSLSIDGHFMVEQFARQRSDFLMNFNGTAGVWRRMAIEEAGGWNAGTLTEDLDLSYRAALRGWKACYVPDLVVPAELVDDIGAYRKQQSRWAQGSIECAIRLGPQVLRSQMPRRIKLAALFHLTGYVSQFLMLLAALTYPFVLGAVEYNAVLKALYVASWVFAPISLAPLTLYSYAQIAIEPRRWWRRLPLLLGLTMLGAGMALNSIRAATRALCRREAAFERTPKSGEVGRRRKLRGGEYALPFDAIVFAELGLCLFNLNTLHLAWVAGNWGIWLYSLFFAIGLACVAGFSVWQAREAAVERLRVLMLNGRSIVKRKSARRAS